MIEPDFPFVRPAKLHVPVGAKGTLLEVEVQRSDGEAHVDEGSRKMPNDLFPVIWPILISEYYTQYGL